MNGQGQIRGGRIDPGWLAEVKRRVRLVELIAPALDKWKPSGEGGRGLCPFHHERTPSFYVVERKGFWHCFGCGAHGDAVGWIMQTTDAREFRDAVAWLAARVGMTAPGSGPVLAPKPIVRRHGSEALAAERARKIKIARAIWAVTRPILSTPADTYLRRARHIWLATLPPTLRFAPALAHPYLERGAAGLPALVGAVQGIDDGPPDDPAGDRRIVGVHCTYLAPDGSGKAAAPAGTALDADWKAKIMRGACWGGAVRLTAAEDLMVIAEGIETALSLLMALWDDDIGCAHLDGEPIGVWAALSLGNLGKLWLPDRVREVILAADSDGKVPAVGACHAKQPAPDELLACAAEPHRQAGRLVRIARPPAGTDFNDLLAAGAVMPAGDFGMAEEIG